MTSHRWSLPMQTNNNFSLREGLRLSGVNGEWGQRSWVPNPVSTGAPTNTNSAPRGAAVLGEEGEWGQGDGSMLRCTSPQNTMWHKTSGDGSESSGEKHTVIYGSGICRQIRNRDLISGKSSSLFESRWGGVCNAQSCSALNLLLFLISRSHLQSRHLSWPQCGEARVGGWADESGWVVISIMWLGAFHVRWEGYGKIQIRHDGKGNKRENSGPRSLQAEWKWGWSESM